MTDTEIKTINIEKYAEALNNLIGVDSAYFNGDKDVDAIVEIISIAKKFESIINHQNAEIERLKLDILIHEDVEVESNKIWHSLIRQAKSEAIKEFAEKFENALVDADCIYVDEEHESFISVNKVGELCDAIYKELTHQATKIEHDSLCETETYESK